MAPPRREQTSALWLLLWFASQDIRRAGAIAAKVGPAASPGPLLVVLDLDETLVHATLFSASGSRTPPSLPAAAPRWLQKRLCQPAADFTAEGKGLVLDIGEEVPLEVSLRPGAKAFVEWLLQQPWLEVGVYTAGTRPYASQVLKSLGLDAAQKVLFRESCEPFGLPVTKDLAKFGRDLKRVVLVDNSESNFWLQPTNGILVSDWDGSSDADDTELARVRGLLLQLTDVGDVRQVLPRLNDGAAAAEESLGKLRGIALFSFAFLAAALSAWLYNTVYA